MKTILPLITIIFAMSISNAQDTPISAFLEKWNNSETYLLQVAEAMPADNYNYKATEREMTFAEQLLHICNNINWLSNTYFNGQKLEKLEGITDKQQIGTLIKDAFTNARKAVTATKPEQLRETVDFFAGSKTRLQILNLLQDHVTHHRAQLIVYLNLNGIEPPRYTGW